MKFVKLEGQKIERKIIFLSFIQLFWPNKLNKVCLNSEFSFFRVFFILEFPNIRTNIMFDRLERSKMFIYFKLNLLSQNF